MLVECGFENVEIPWRADVFRGAPQDKNSATFGTLGVNFRARKVARGETREVAETRMQHAAV